MTCCHSYSRWTPALANSVSSEARAAKARLLKGSRVLSRSVSLGCGLNCFCVSFGACYRLLETSMVDYRVVGSRLSLLLLVEMVKFLVLVLRPAGLVVSGWCCGSCRCCSTMCGVASIVL